MAPRICYPIFFIVDCIVFWLKVTCIRGRVLQSCVAFDIGAYSYEWPVVIRGATIDAAMKMERDVVTCVVLEMQLCVNLYLLQLERLPDVICVASDFVDGFGCLDIFN